MRERIKKQAAVLLIATSFVTCVGSVKCFDTAIAAEDNKLKVETKIQKNGEDGFSEKSSDKNTDNAKKEEENKDSALLNENSGVKKEESFDKGTDTATKNDVDKEKTDKNINVKIDHEYKTGEEKTSTRLKLDFTVLKPMVTEKSYAAMEIYTKDGKKLAEVGGQIEEGTSDLSFDVEVPRYKLGETFVLKLKGGLYYIKYYDRTYSSGEDIELQTYCYKDDAGKIVKGDSFAFDAHPLFEHAIVLYIDGKIQSPLPKARLVESTAMIPLRAAAEELGFEVKYDSEYYSVVCQAGNKQIIFNIDESYVTVMGEDIIMSKKCTWIDGSIFVPARSFAEIVGSQIDAIDFGDHIDVCIGKSSIAAEYFDTLAVNKWKLSSKTDYLVWIDKSDYRVRVYKGHKNCWREIESFPCAIGAVNSPTITGSYEYEYKMDAWHYDGYYVGPCLVFYGNYAMHSTLLRYDNTPYDDRVGVMISHGCVRLHKHDIDRLEEILPVGSRVYITE